MAHFGRGLRFEDRHALVPDDVTLRQLAFARVWNFAEDVSVIGSRYVVDRTKTFLQRAVWLLLILVGLGLAAYQIEERMVYYLSWPGQTQVTIRQANELNFPQVTICNENSISRHAAEDMGE